MKQNIESPAAQPGSDVEQSLSEKTEQTKNIPGIEERAALLMESGQFANAAEAQEFVRTLDESFKQYETDGKMAETYLQNFKDMLAEAQIQIQQIRESHPGALIDEKEVYSAVMQGLAENFSDVFKDPSNEKSWQPFRMAKLLGGWVRDHRKAFVGFAIASAALQVLRGMPATEAHAPEFHPHTDLLHPETLDLSDLHPDPLNLTDLHPDNPERVGFDSKDNYFPDHSHDGDLTLITADDILLDDSKVETDPHYAQHFDEKFDALKEVPGAMALDMENAIGNLDIQELQQNLAKHPMTLDIVSLTQLEDGMLKSSEIVLAPSGEQINQPAGEMLKISGIGYDSKVALAEALDRVATENTHIESSTTVENGMLGEDSLVARRNTKLTLYEIKITESPSPDNPNEKVFQAEISYSKV